MEILVCPLCESRLELRVLSERRKDGVLTCKNAHSYPITNGLPRVLPGDLQGDYADFVTLYKDVLQSSDIHLDFELDSSAESRQVQEAFREKWTSKDTMGITDSSPWRKFIREWMFRKYGWIDQAGFAAQLNDKKLILDAGAGLGREVMNMAQVAKTAIVVGLEFSDCAVNALKNVASFGNTCIIQGDIMRMPFAKESFDFILSEGVLHHTPDSREAFTNCCKVLKKGGEIAFYVYRKKGALREFADDHLRQIMQEASNEERWRIAEGITLLGKALSDARATVSIPEDIPELGIKKGAVDVQRFIYWNFLKCFWNDDLPFDENRIVNFDWYVPKHGHRHTEREIREWCRENGIEIVWFHGEESGFSVRGKKLG